MRHKSRKAAGWLLSLSLVLGLLPMSAFAADEYNLWVGDTQVTSENSSGSGWSYDSNSNTLTLTNFDNNNAYYEETEAGVYSTDGYRIAAGIYYAGEETLTIELNDTNSVTMPEVLGDKLDNAAIFSKVDINFTGTGTLKATGGITSDTDDESSVGSTGIYCKGTASFSGTGEITASGAEAELSTGFHGGTIIVKDGKVNFIGGNVSSETSTSMGAYCTDSFTVTGGDIRAAGGAAKYSYGVRTKNAELDAGETQLTAGEASSRSRGLYVDGNMTIADGIIQTSGGNVTGDKGISYGLYCERDFTITNGTLNAVGGSVSGDSGRSSGIAGDWFKCNISGGTITANGGDVFGNTGTSYGFYAGIYPVYITSGSLKAQGGTVSGTDGKSYGFNGSITSIDLEGDADVSCIGGNVSGDNGASYGVNCTGLRQEGGVMESAGGSAASYSCGILGKLTIRVSDGDLIATGGTAPRSHGIYSNHLVDMVGGTITASASQEVDEHAGIYMDSFEYEDGTKRECALTISDADVTGDIFMHADTSARISGTSYSGTITNHGEMDLTDGVYNGPVKNSGMLTIYNGTYRDTVSEESVEGSGAMVINGGQFDNVPVANADEIYLNGGKFKTDPTDGKNIIIPETKEIVNLADEEYPYQLTDKMDTKATIKVDQGNTVGSVDTAKITDSTAQAAAESAAQSTAANLKDATVVHLGQIIKDSQTVTDTTKNIVVVPSLEVKAEDYKIDGDNTTMTLDIEAVYSSYETDSSITTADQVASAGPDQVKKIGSGKLDTSGTPVNVSIKVPTAFAEAMGATTDNVTGSPITIYVNHLHNDKSYEYIAKLFFNRTGYTVEFTNPDGFSSFKLMKTSSAIATSVIRGENVYYTSFQDAVDEVPYGGTITLCKDGLTKEEMSATVKTETEFTVDFGYTINNWDDLTITAGSGFVLSEKEDIAAITYTTSKQSSHSSSGGGGGGIASYQIVCPDSLENGAITSDMKTASKGTSITLTATPNEGYVLDTLKVTDQSGKDVDLTKKDDGTYSFTMPASKVTVTAIFKEADSSKPADTSCPKDSTCPLAAFSDLNPAKWYHDGIEYCLKNKIMNGVGEKMFAPDGTTSRAMIVTILYRVEGEPAIRSGLPFDDVTEDDRYAMPVSWAESHGIATGYGNGKFGPNDAVTREQLAAILYRYADYKEIDTSVGEDTNILSFGDVGSWSDWSVPALQWAVGTGIINGKDGNLVPKGNASRAEAAAMIQRFCENVGTGLLSFS